MRKKRGVQGICFILALVLLFTGIFPGNKGYAMEGGETALSESSYLYPFEEAVDAFNKMAESQELTAAVYLEDELYLRLLPQKESEPVAQVVSGDVVSLLGVGQDENYQIWYHVQATKEEETVKGYLPKENLACTQEEFLQWEETYVRSMGKSSSRYYAPDFSDVESFPKSYQHILKEVKKKHPQWIFVKMNTGISWDTLIESQKGERSLVYSPTSADNWKEGSYGTTKWSYASEGIIRYFIDPRNWLEEKNIFQFELLAYSSQYHTEKALQNILANSFMAKGILENNKSYAQTFIELGQNTGVSPFLMAARIRQEQGTGGTSALISGTYPGYEGYYNYYNIGASGKTDKEVIVNGLEKAVKEGWNTRVKSLIAGAAFLGGSYIHAGQDTLYLQKFDVDSRNNGVFWHQYMQNIQAPSTEGGKVYQAYQKSGLLNEAFIFRIPVYENMPSSASVLPGKEDKITLSYEEITDLQIGSEVTLHPFINGKEAPEIEWSFSSSDEGIATVDEKGTVQAKEIGTVTITCKKKEDMSNTLEGSCRITVVKAKLDLESLEKPKLDAVVYDPGQTLADISLPEGYQWVNPQIIPNVSQENYSVSYNPDPQHFDSVTFDIVLMVKKALPQYEVPGKLQGAAGRELRSVTLPQGFWWNNPEEMLDLRIGVKEYLASYNPDAFNYETVEEIMIPVEIICEIHEFGEWEIKEATCEEAGAKKRSCKVCDVTEELILEATGHQYKIQEETEATQEKEGKRVYNCSLCGHSYEEKIPKLPMSHEHSYEKNILKKASCTQPGLAEYVCACKDSYQEVIEPLGHEIKEGTCIICGFQEQNAPSGSVPSQGEGNSSQDTSAKEEQKPEQEKKPEEEKKPETEQKPEEEKKPEAEQKPEEEKKPETEQKPEEEKKPEAEQKPEEEKKPDTEQKPEEEKKPETEQKPEEEKKPDTEQKPGGDNKPNNSPENGSSGQNVQQQKPQDKGQQNAQSSPENGESKDKGENNVFLLKEPQNNEQVQGNSTTEGMTKNQSREYVEVDLMSLLVENTPKEEPTKEKEDIILELAKNTEVSQHILKMARNYGVDMQIGLSNGLTWEIFSTTMEEILPEQLNMGAEITENIIPRKLVEMVSRDTDYLELSLEHQGEFGFEASLTIPGQESRQGKVANLYYYNPQENQLEFIMATEVTKEGNILLTFTHASEYLIVFADTSLEQDKIIAEDTKTAEEIEEIAEENKEVKEEKTYTSLITIVSLVMVLALGFIAMGIVLMRKKTQEEFFDEDVDDYQEKQQITEKIIQPSRETHHTEEEFFDEDIDDYQEKSREKEELEKGKEKGI